MTPSSDVFIEYLLVLDIHSIAFMPILSFFDVLYHFNYSNRTVQSAISFTKITYHTAKIFRFFKKTIVVQILLYMYSTIVNNSKKVIRIVFSNGCILNTW